MTSQNTPAWRNDDLEGAVIGAFFLRGADPEVMDILVTLPADVFSVRAYRDIYTGICRQARVSGVIDPVLLCNEMPELAPVITDTGRKTGEVFTGALCCSVAAQCRIARCRKNAE